MFSSKLLATVLSRRLWAEFRIHGYPAKVGVSVDGLREVLDAQGCKCYDCGSDLEPALTAARGMIKKKTTQIICENCHARPKN